MDPDPNRYPMILVECEPDEVDVLVGTLSLAGAEAIEERDGTTLLRGGARGVTLLASFGDEATAREALEGLARPDARLDFVVGDAWRDAWKEHWKPTPIGSRLLVVPSWMDAGDTQGRRVLRLDPGRAFGTGQHASTVLAAEAVERVLANAPGHDVLDVGCGSGILSFAALLLGARRSLACDVDAEAVTAAQENAASLELADRFDARTGGLEVLPERAPLVVANIEATVLVPMARDLATRVAPGGRLILSGILTGQLDEVRHAYESAGLRSAGAVARDGWVAPEFDRP